MVDYLLYRNPYHLLLILCIFNSGTYQSGKRNYNYIADPVIEFTSVATPPAECNTTVAKVGQRLQLDCSTRCFQTNGFSWLNGSQVLESGYSRSYLVTNNVTISEVVGQNYSCICETSYQRQCFSIWGRFIEYPLAHVSCLSIIAVHSYFNHDKIDVRFIVNPRL